MSHSFHSPLGVLHTTPITGKLSALLSQFPSFIIQHMLKWQSCNLPLPWMFYYITGWESGRCFSLEGSHIIVLTDFPGEGVCALSLALKCNDLTFWARFPCLVSFDSIYVSELIMTNRVCFVLFCFAFSFLVWRIHVLQSICHIACPFHRDFYEKGEFLAHLSPWPLKSFLISPLLEDSREKRALVSHYF